MPVSSLCGVKANNALVAQSTIADKVQNMFDFLTNGNSEKIVSITDTIKECYSAFLQQSRNIDMATVDIFRNIDSFVEHITKGAFNSMKALESQKDHPLIRDEVDRDIKAFADIAVSVLNNDNMEFLRKTQDVIDHYASTRSFLIHSAELMSVNKWAENKFVKFLTFTPFTFDRAAIFNSSPIIRPVYDELTKLDSQVNRLHANALKGKERIASKLRDANLSEADFGKIVETMISVSQYNPDARSEVVDVTTQRSKADDLILSKLREYEGFEAADEVLLAHVKDVWMSYRKMNYGSSIGESMFDLPAGYNALDPKYADGFLPSFIIVNIRKANLADAVRSTGNINLDHEYIKDAITIAEQFKVEVKDGIPEIKWKWKKDYYPHASEISNDASLANHILMDKSTDEAAALYSKSNLNSIDPELAFNALTENIENIRSRTNQSSMRLFSAYLAGISNHNGQGRVVDGLVLGNGRHEAYDAWISTMGKAGDNNMNHRTIIEYVDKISESMSKQVDSDLIKANSWFKKHLQAIVGLTAQAPLSTSAVNNIVGAGSQMATELGIKDAVSVLGEWFTESTPGSTEKLIKDMVKDHQLQNAHGIKLTEHSSINYEQVENIKDANFLIKTIDKVSDTMIKTGQHISDQGILSPITLIASALQHSIEAANTVVKYDKLKSVSSGIETVLGKTKGRFWSMSGSEELILNVEGSIKYSMVSNAITLRNAGLKAGGRNPMTIEQTKSFTKELMEHPLFKSEVMDKWKHIAGDFSNHAKPFWAWLDAQDAATKTEIVTAVIKQAYSMFRPVGTMIVRSAGRGVVKSFSKNNIARKRVGATILQGMLAAYYIANNEEGVSIPIVANASAITTAIKPSLEIANMIKIFGGLKMTESEYQNTLRSFSSVIGGVPFGGTIERFAQGAIGETPQEASSGLSSHKISKGLQNLFDDMADPLYMIKAVIETTHMTDESINKLNSYKQAYSSNGVPMINTLTSLNKPFKTIIEGFRIAGGMAGARLSDDPKEKNALYRDVQSNIARTALSVVGLNSFIKYNTIDANSTAKARRERLEHNKEFADGWKGIFK